MAYNLKEYKSEPTRTSNFVNIISILNPIPDILVAIEINDDPVPPGITAENNALYFLNNVMNSFGAYSLEIHTTDIDDENAIYYNSEFDFIESKIVVENGNHPTLEYKLKHASSGYEIIIYAVHLSSTTKSQRDSEADGIRTLTDIWADDLEEKYFIAAGDYNFANGGSEDAYATLTDQTNLGYFIDPANGNFGQAYYTFDIDGNASSFDERYDMILNSQSIVNPVIQGRVKYVSNSFVVAGNDGSGILNNVPADYIAASDHLPVYAEYDFGGITPVELAFFTGSLNGNDVELRWRTESEVNNYGFYIERASENSDWSIIGFVEGYGNSNSPKHYSYSDVDIYQSANYSYRLKQTDIDGTYEFSKIVEVEIAPAKFALYQNYPNPFNPTTKIKYSIPPQHHPLLGGDYRGGLITLKVYDILGNEIATLVNEEKSAGTYEVEFSANGGSSSLASGMYVYIMQAGNFVQSKKMLMIK